MTKICTIIYHDGLVETLESDTNAFELDFIALNSHHKGVKAIGFEIKEHKRVGIGSVHFYSEELD